MDEIQERLEEIRGLGLYRKLRLISGPQGPRVLLDGRPVLLLCSNNYLGLADHPRVREAAAEAAMRYGVGAGASRLISGNMTIHRRLEEQLAEFKGTPACVLFGSGYLANTGVVSALAREGDVVFSDALNHASIVDGCRLARAETVVYDHCDMEHLEWGLREADGRGSLIVTDGVFSMDGDVARLPEICDLAERHDALVMVDDSHASGFMGRTGRGTAEHCGVTGRIDMITTTFGKALGGASGGCIAAHREIVDLMRQRSRPYLFSNTLAPSIAAGTLAVLEMLSSTTDLRDRLERNTRHFREGIAAAGFEIKPGVHPIVPIMLYDAKLSQVMAKDLLDEGIYVIGFYFPVVPKGQARIRVQISAAHETSHLDRAVEAFTKIGRKHGVLR